MFGYPLTLIKELQDKNKKEITVMTNKENTNEDDREGLADSQWEEKPIKLKMEQEMRVKDMVQTQEFKNAANVGKCFVAKKKMMIEMMEDGYKVMVPKQFRWHQSHKGDENFI